MAIFRQDTAACMVEVGFKATLVPKTKLEFLNRLFYFATLPYVCHTMLEGEKNQKQSTQETGISESVEKVCRYRNPTVVL